MRACGKDREKIAGLKLCILSFFNDNRRNGVGFVANFVLTVCCVMIALVGRREK
jgi:hypothetical protein